MRAVLNLNVFLTRRGTQTAFLRRLITLGWRRMTVKMMLCAYWEDVNLFIFYFSVRDFFEYPTTRLSLTVLNYFIDDHYIVDNVRQMYHSHYKSHATNKKLIGIKPSGKITFVSQLYKGCILDKSVKVHEIT